MGSVLINFSIVAYLITFVVVVVVVGIHDYFTVYSFGVDAFA